MHNPPENDDIKKTNHSQVPLLEHTTDKANNNEERSCPSICPRIIHHNWFGPLLPKAERNLLEQNVIATSPTFLTIVWMSTEFSDPEAYESNSSYIDELQERYNLNVEHRDIASGRHCITSPSDMVMLKKLWKDTQRIREIRFQNDVTADGVFATPLMKVTWIAAMSDFMRMKAVLSYGGIWADIGDSRFPQNFADLWLEKNLLRVQDTYMNIALDLDILLN